MFVSKFLLSWDLEYDFRGSRALEYLVERSSKSPSVIDYVAHTPGHFAFLMHERCSIMILDVVPESDRLDGKSLKRLREFVMKLIN